MAKITLQDVTAGYNAATRINANNDAIETAFENTLSRDGTSPNSMNADLDMNSNRILNLPAPTTASEPARWVDVTSATGIQIAPNQSGNSNKALKTDGTSATWAYPGSSALPLHYDQTAAEITAGVTPANYNIQPYVRGRYTNFADWKSACDGAGAEGSLDADYALTANITLPRRCHFKGFQLTGAYYSTHTGNLNGGYVHEWKALQPRIQGGNGNRYTGIHTGGTGSLPSDTGFITVDGGGVGLEWAVVDIIYTNKLEISASNGFVNQNTFIGGVARYVHITGGSSEVHGNKFVGIDASDNSSGASPSGYLQDDTAFQRNIILGGYYEGSAAGTTIVGNWDVLYTQGDATKMPQLSRTSHLFCLTGVNQRLSKDFLSISVSNLALGGQWDIVDASNKPPCLAQSGGASVASISDTTEPCGMRRRYEATFADAFDNFQITIQPSGQDRFGIVVFYKSTADFFAIESNDGSGAISHTPAPVTVDSTNNWKMLRISGPASKTATTSITLYGYGASGGTAKVMSIGGIFAGAERAVIVPHRQQSQYRYGSATYDPGSLADGAGVTTTITVTGVDTTMFARASFSNDLQGITLTAWVSSANTVSVRFQNESGGTLDLASGTLRVEVKEPYA